MQEALIYYAISEEKLQYYLDQLYKHAVAVIDGNDCLYCCNRVFLEMTGYTQNQLLGENVGRFLEIPSMSNGRELEQGHSLLLRDYAGRGITSRYFQGRFTGPNGEEFTMLHLQDLKPGDDLNLLQQFAGTLLQDINLGVLLFDTDYKLIDISDMACRIFGIERGKVINKLLSEVFHELPEEHQPMPKGIFEGILYRNHALSWTNNGERYELLVDSNILRDHAGRIQGGYVTFKDVTNLRSLEEQVQRNDRLSMIGQIAAGTAHEIRNPLTSIKGFLQMFRNTFIEKEMDKEKSYADIMLMEIDRINELVNEFLLLSKHKNVNYELVDIPLVLKEIMPIIHSEATLHDITVQQFVAEGLPRVIADREMLKQVFLNISKNGIEAMSGEGVLTVQVKRDVVENRLLIDIHDTGPGIPHFVVDKIFDPFFTTKPNGTGLGLSVCQRIIHDIGGIIRVSSKGFGTTFTVSIPIP
ncbi:ATP-binding protein [Paenibacillus sp. YN15]|uniref:ATP-binding protein n=1 Tax=Paenibacillus sp. YN15 TaxID=1742774 RepID=UPI000DCF03FC|nr:ATP-binding protein [Paenibacillus sp. YN15]RAU97872.1 PAS domain-containing sensor histidine kinase [Paenibacillus sp. YN15]